MGNNKMQVVESIPKWNFKEILSYIDEISSWINTAENQNLSDILVTLPKII
jgi:hypothetical protein